MFDKDPRFNKLGQDIWVYHNFLSTHEIGLILDRIKNSGEEIWDSRDPQKKYTIGLKEAEIISKKIQNLLSDNLNVDGHSTVTRLKIDQYHGVHSDNHDFLEKRALSKLLKENDCYVLEDNNVYGLVVYLNDNYEGGEIYYTKQSIIYKPKAGDLIIHSAEEHCEHGVYPVKTNIRYSHPSSIREKIKVPCY